MCVISGRFCKDFLYTFFWVIPRLLYFVCRCFGTLYSILIGGASRFSLLILPMKMDQTECSEASAYKIQKPGNHPKEIIRKTFRTQRKFEIKHYTDLFIVVLFFPNYYILEREAFFNSKSLHSPCGMKCYCCVYQYRYSAVDEKICVIPTLKKVQWWNRALSIHLEMHLNTADTLK